MPADLCSIRRNGRDALGSSNFKWLAALQVRRRSSISFQGSGRRAVVEIADALKKDAKGLELHIGSVDTSSIERL